MEKQLKEKVMDELASGAAIVFLFSNCCCDFSWSYDEETKMLRCEVEHHSCFIIKTLEAAHQKILTCMLNPDGSTYTCLLDDSISQDRIPDDLYQRVQLNINFTRDDVYFHEHNGRFRQSLDNFMRSSGYLLDIRNETPFICKVNQPVENDTGVFMNWMWGLDHMFKEEIVAMEWEIDLLDFTQFGTNYSFYQNDQLYYVLTDGEQSVDSDPYIMKEDAESAIKFMRSKYKIAKKWSFNILKDFTGRYVIHCMINPSPVGVVFSSTHAIY